MLSAMEEITDFEWVETFTPQWDLGNVVQCAGADQFTMFKSAEARSSEKLAGMVDFLTWFQGNQLDWCKSGAIPAGIAMSENEEFLAMPQSFLMHHMFVLSNESENPMQGAWECSPMEGMDDKFAIDGTIMELSQKRYFLWSGWEGYENVRQDIYLAEMVSPTQIADEKILLSKPELDWEKNGNPLVNEGPEVIVRGSTVNLVYSASGSWTDDYCLGLLTMDIDGEPKNPDSWTKQQSPLMSRDLDVYGPGHNCFTTSLDGTEDLIVYHAARWMGAGWSRSVRFGYVDFDEDGRLKPIPVTSGEDLEKIPSGEPQVSVYGADQFALSGDVELCGDSEAAYAAGMISTEDIVEVTIDAKEEQDASVTVFVKTDDLLEGVVSGLEARLNGEAKSQEIYAGENYQPLYFSFHLEKGGKIYWCFALISEGQN